ncbi:MAG: hypothetical protein ABWZ52_10160 [Acidimicrobiales bacterium]
MRIPAAALRLGLAALVIVAAGCGDGDGSGPDITLPSTTATDAGAAGTTTTEAPTTTEEPTTTRPPITATTRPDRTTTTAEEVTTTTEGATTTTSAASDGEEAAPPAEPDSEADDGTTWWWLPLVLLAAAILGFIVWRRSKSGPPWSEQARLLADEIRAAGASVLMGPSLTDDLWTSALARSNEVRAQAEPVLDHAPSTAARQAVSEAMEALRLAEVRASAARGGTAGAETDAQATAELSAAVDRLRAVATPPPGPPA